jgi:hypothetical protein
MENLDISTQGIASEFSGIGKRPEFPMLLDFSETDLCTFFVRLQQQFTPSEGPMVNRNSIYGLGLKKAIGLRAMIPLSKRSVSSGYSTAYMKIKVVPLEWPM